MSLYNMVLGETSVSSVALAMLDITRNEVPRYRDAGFTLQDETPVIYIHTRTGGGNRDFYESEDTCRENYPDYFRGDSEDPDGPWNEDLRSIAGYISDSDDDYDSTYANFYFGVPEAFVEFVKSYLDKNGPAKTAGERWEACIAAIRSGKFGE